MESLAQSQLKAAHPNVQMLTSIGDANGLNTVALVRVGGISSEQAVETQEFPAPGCRPLWMNGAAAYGKVENLLNSGHPARCDSARVATMGFYPTAQTAFGYDDVPLTQRGLHISRPTTLAAAASGRLATTSQTGP